MKIFEINKKIFYDSGITKKNLNDLKKSWGFSLYFCLFAYTEITEINFNFIYVKDFHIFYIFNFNSLRTVEFSNSITKNIFLIYQIYHTQWMR